MTSIDIRLIENKLRQRDFILFACPRSGSNMTASAINSHSKLICFGNISAHEDHEWLGGDAINGELDGELVSHLEHFYSEEVGADKIIGLIRTPEDILASRHATIRRRNIHYVDDAPAIPTRNVNPGANSHYSSHTLEMVEEELEGIIKHTKRFDGIIIRYEDLIIPGEPHKMNRKGTDPICEYLNVPYEELTTRTTKLPVLTPKRVFR